VAEVGDVEEEGVTVPHHDGGDGVDAQVRDAGKQDWVAVRVHVDVAEGAEAPLTAVLLLVCLSKVLGRDDRKRRLLVLVKNSQCQS